MSLRYDDTTLEVKLASGGTSGDGTAKPTEEWIHKAVGIDGTFVATVQVQGTLDGTNFHNIGSALTAPGTVDVGDFPWKKMRIKTTAYTSGTPVATLAGRLT